MKKRITITTLIFSIFISIAVTFSIVFAIMGVMYSNSLRTIAQSYSNALNNQPNALAGVNAGGLSEKVVQKLNEIDQVARKYYVGEIDDESLVDMAIRGYIVGLGDRHAAYMNEQDFSMSTEENLGHSVGIGINVFYDNTLQGLYVINVNEGEPADVAGIVPGDVIVAVNGKSVAEAGYYGTINTIKQGKVGESFNVTVVRMPDYTVSEEIVLTRKEISIITVKERMLSADVGYIEISEFNRSTSLEFITALDNLKSEGAKKFIFDVRNNPGGDLVGINEVLDYLLPEGPIIRINSKSGNEEVIYSDKHELVAPMVVICNGNTASAAELFTCALMDYDKAVSVGTVTYGKGTMQTVFPLSSGGAFSVSTAYYNPPYSDNYNEKGVFPDVQIELPPELEARFYKMTDKEDVQLMKALEIINDK